jgi:hypothetical protein
MESKSTGDGITLNDNQTGGTGGQDYWDQASRNPGVSDRIPPTTTWTPTIQPTSSLTELLEAEEDKIVEEVLETHPTTPLTPWTTPAQSTMSSTIANNPVRGSPLDNRITISPTQWAPVLVAEEEDRLPEVNLFAKNVDESQEKSKKSKEDKKEKTSSSTKDDKSTSKKSSTKKYSSIKSARKRTKSYSLEDENGIRRKRR